MRHHKMTVTTVMTALFLLGALIVGLPYCISRLYYRHDHSFDTTKWIMAGYVAFFLLVAGVLTPLIRYVWKSLKISNTSPFDALISFLVRILSVPVLFILWSFAIPLMRLSVFARYKYYIYNGVCSTTFLLLGALVRFRGVPPKKDQQYISIFNHTSGEIDYVLASITQGVRPWNIVAGINLRRNKKRIKDWLIAQTIGKIVEEHSIYLDRSNDESRFNTLKRIMQELADGKNIAIFPEGGRTKYVDIIEKKIILQKFWYPIFKIAFERGVPVQPVVFDWPVIWRGKDDTRYGIRPCMIDVHFLDLVDPSQFACYEDLQEYCWQVMFDKLSSSKKVQRFLQ